MWTPRPILGSWTPDQERVARAFPAKRRVVVPAANGVGKTFLAADLVVSFIVDMLAAKIIITAPTNRQVSELLWPHITERLLQLGLVGIEWQIPTKPKWKGGDGDSLIGFATNTPQRLQGFHAPRLLIVCDEASGMPASLVEALEGIANADENYILAIGNPNTADGAFFEMTRRPSYHVETISALTHPNILEHREVIPGATSWTSLVDRLRDWCKEVETPTEETFSLQISDAELQSGPDDLRRLRTFLPNDAFRVRYLGRFPAAASWALIPTHHITWSIDRMIPGDRPKVAALDVARTGGDRSIYGLRVGDSVTKIRVLQPQELMKQAEEVAAILRHDQPESITIDAAGLGIGLVDRLRQICDVCPIHAFQGAEEPRSPLMQRKYFNRRAQAYGYLAEAMANERCSIPRDDELLDELRWITYKHTDDGRMIMHDKEEIKTKTGRSPDKADMVSLLWDCGTSYEWGGAAPVAVRRPEPEKW